MTFLISDIHGMYNTLLRLITRIQALDPHCQLVFLGDYVDGGMFSYNVIEYLIDMHKRGHVALRGNHDDMLDWILNDHHLSSFNKNINVQNLPGFDKTMTSYGELNKNLQEFKECVPERHKNFIKSLPIFWQNETHFACHGFMEPASEPNFSEEPHNVTKCLWGEFEHMNTCWTRIGVFGHISGKKYKLDYPYKKNNIRIIDDGGAHGESLVAYCCEDDSFIREPIHRIDLP